MAVITPLLIIVALLGKWLYFSWIDRDDNPGATMQTATGLSHAAVRLLDLGHTAENFTTREFGYQAPHRARQGARLTLYGCFLVAAVLFSAFDSTSALTAVILATAATVVAVFAERWLFFVEARQAVMLYHGLIVNDSIESRGHSERATTIRLPTSPSNK